MINYISYSTMLWAVARAVTSPFPTAIESLCGDYPFPYYALFFHLTRLSEPQSLVCVELGVEKGRGAASMAAGNERALVYGLDNNKRDEIASLEETYPGLDVREISALPVPDHIPDCIDLLHVDTEHSYGNAKNEFGQYKSRLNPAGAVVCFDDTHAMEDGVLQFVHEMPYPKIIDDRLHPVCGYAVIYYTRDE